MSCDIIAKHCALSFAAYHELLAKGVPRELARAVLPTSTYTRFFGTVNLHNLLRFLSLRLDPHAQWEIRQYAQALLNLLHQVCPVTAQLWTELNTSKGA